jgi:hypothetical protein
VACIEVSCWESEKILPHSRCGRHEMRLGTFYFGFCLELLICETCVELGTYVVAPAPNVSICFIASML